jgi:hypothetical protein
VEEAKFGLSTPKGVRGKVGDCSHFSLSLVLMIGVELLELMKRR